MSTRQDRRSIKRAILPAILGLILLSPTMALAAACPQHIVISQLYGGGGWDGAAYKNDFVELHNPTDAALSLSGLALQHASSDGSGWAANVIFPDVSIPAGGYFLIKGISNGDVGADLPVPDFTAGFGIGTVSGKVALTMTTIELNACPAEPIAVDLVGYDGSASCFEGAAAPAASVFSSIARLDAGCRDTNSNSTDFALSTPPAPRNSASTVKVCSCIPTIGGCSLDADGNGVIDALTDGLVMVRAMFGLTGTAVTNSAIGSNASRTSWNQIRTFLNDNCGTQFAP